MINRLHINRLHINRLHINRLHINFKMRGIERSFKRKILLISNKKKAQFIYLHKCLSRHNLYSNCMNIYNTIYNDREKDMRILLGYRKIYIALWKELNILEELKYLIVQYINIKNDIY